MVKNIVISSDQAGQRLDNFLVTHLKGVPKSRIYRALRKGEVRINKKRIKPEYRLQADDVVRIPPIKTAERTPEVPGPGLCRWLVSQIIYENDDVIILNKPAGLPVHGGSGVKYGVIEILRTALLKSPFLELAHRLDRGTSGCLVITKKRSVLTHLHEQFASGKVEKHYLAVVMGHLKNEREVNVPLKKYDLPSGERRVKVSEDGKQAKTLFMPLKSKGNMTLVLVKLFTGRMHQIRVHTAYLKHPIAGDDKYGSDAFNKEVKAKGIKRMLLHSASIAFELPDNERVSVCAICDFSGLLHS